MKEEYWLEAEKMLEAQDERRKRRIGFWWFGGGLGVLLLVGFGIWIFGKNDLQKNHSTQSHIAIKSPEIDANSSQNTGVKTLEKAGIETTESPSSNFKNLPEAQHDKTTLTRSEKQYDEEKITRSLSPKSKSKYAELKNSDDTKINAQSSIEKSVAVADFPASSPSESSHSEALQALDSKSIENPTAENERGTTPDFLTLLPYYVTGDFVNKELATTAQDIDVANPRKLHFGLLASQLLIPKSAGDKTFIGQRGGLVIQYDFKNEFHLCSGMQYLRRTGSFDASKTAIQHNYRFGLELQELELRPTSLHYLSLPILLGWGHNGHELEAGFSIDYLAGVRGETGSYQKQGDPPVKVFKAEKSGWVTSDGYRRIAPTLQLIYGYKLMDRWSIGLSANYSVGGIIDKNYVPPVGSFLMKESEKFQLGAFLVYFFN